MDDTIPIKKCLVCGSDSLEIYIKFNEGVYRCPQCGKFQPAKEDNFFCDTCSFFSDDAPLYGPDAGYCRINPPILSTVEESFPVVRGSRDWCGKYKIGRHTDKRRKTNPESQP